MLKWSKITRYEKEKWKKIKGPIISCAAPTEQINKVTENLKDVIKTHKEKKMKCKNARASSLKKSV